MPALKPIKRRKLIQNLRALGFDGPYSGGNHQYMVKGERKLFIPNPHSGDISAPLLNRLLRQAGIDRGDWLNL